MNRDLLREIRIKLEAINSNIPNVSNTTGIEAKLDELIETTKEQNKISEQILEALETLNSKNSINSVVNTAGIEEKLENIWDILYETKHGLN